MGRPLKKSFFGDPTGGSNRLALTSAWIPGAGGTTTAAYIIRQVGTGKYEVTDGVYTGVVALMAAGSVTSGFAQLVIAPYGLSDEYASKIYNRSIRTFAGNSYMWSTVAASETGQADLPFTAIGQPPTNRPTFTVPVAPLTAIVLTVPTFVGPDAPYTVTGYVWSSSSTLGGTYTPLVGHGATTGTYTMQVADVSLYLKCTVAVTDKWGGTSSISSIAQQLPAIGLPPTNLPTFTAPSAPGIGATITLTVPTFVGPDAPYTVTGYVWASSATSGGSYTPLVGNGATTITYTMQAGDASQWLKCTVSVTDTFGGTSTISSAPHQLPAT